jgi:uncharacterized protein
MSIQMSDLSVAVFGRMLRNLSRCLDQGLAYAAERKFDPQVLFSARLAPDMFPLNRQVQIACDFAKGCSARLAGVEVPKKADDEKTLEDLQARIRWTCEFIEGIPVDKFAAAAERAIVHEMRTMTIKLPGSAYLQEFSLPNFYFHLTTTYAILRHNGVPVGKNHYMGR